MGQWYDAVKYKGVQTKGFKMFLNKDASYESVLERSKDELYEATERDRR